MENELMHFGVKGQKWGVRRYQNPDGSLTLAGKKRALKVQNDYTELSKNKKYHDKDGNLTYEGRKRALKMKEQYSSITGKSLKAFPNSNSNKGTATSKPKTKNISEMSNEEIQAKIDRMRLVNNYRNVMNESISNISKKETSKGREFVKEVVANAGKNIATQTATWAMGTIVNKTIESITGEKNAINPKKGQKDK